MSRTTIKYIVTAAMAGNHIARIFLPQGSFLCEFLKDLGYMTAITMCYFLVEGFRYTSSRKRYANRLLIFGLISQIPFWLAFAQKGSQNPISLNMLFTLFLCFKILEVQEMAVPQNNKTVLTLCLALATIICDWTVLAALFTIWFYQAQGKRRMLKYAFLFAGLLTTLTELFEPGPWEVWQMPNVLRSLGAGAALWAAGFLIMNLYNGEAGGSKNGFSRWFFYWFYPAHLLILGIVRIALVHR